MGGHLTILYKASEYKLAAEGINSYKGKGFELWLIT